MRSGLRASLRCVSWPCLLFGRILIRLRDCHCNIDRARPDRMIRHGSAVMISGLVQILLFQGVGELVTHFLLPLIPGPVIGLILLLGFLALRKGVNASLDDVAITFSQHFGLLLVPGLAQMTAQITSGFPNIYEIWVYLSGSPLLALILTLGAYQVGVIVYERAKRHPLANPVLIAIA